MATNTLNPTLKQHIIRLAPFLIMLMIISSCSHQKAENKSLKGQWWTCNPSLGYTEILIADTTIHYLNAQSIHSYPTIFKTDSPEKISLKNGFISLINGNSALIKTEYGTHDTIFRLKEHVLNYFDFDCSENISRADFNQILEHEFLIRSVKNSAECTPLLPNKLGNPAPVISELLDFVDTYKPSPVHDVEFDFEFVSIRKANGKNANDKITFNEDSTRFLITFQGQEICNDDFRVEPIFFKNGELKIHLFKYPSFCSDSCLIDFYVLIENYEKFDFKNWELIEHD